MRKAKDTEKAAASGSPVISGTAAETGTPASTVEKPRRGRKPKTAKKQEEEEAPAQEPETTVNAADGEQAGMPSEAPPEAGTAAKSAGTKEPATGDGNAQEEAVAVPENTEESGEAETVPVPVSGADAQVVESPLQQMKQEFHRRSQVIRKEMGNIQNSFVVIGFQLHWIYENNMFHVLRYKSIYDYAEKEYNIKRTTCCNLINIIENYAERDGNGEVVESIAECYRNYSASQLVAMLGMDEELKRQVTPDMSVRAINRLRRGEPEPGTVETTFVEGPAPVREDAGKPAAVEEAEPAETPGEDGPVEEHAEKTADEIHEETADTGTGSEDAERRPWETAPADDATLAEIDSYSDYKSMADELDLIMKQVFSADSPVRVRIVCVQG